jgi:hypothetical protein
MLRHFQFLLTSLLSVNWISTFSIIMLLLEFRFNTAILHYLLHRYECYALGFFAFIYSYVFSCYKTYELFFSRNNFCCMMFSLWFTWLPTEYTNWYTRTFVMSLCTVSPPGHWRSPHLLGFVTEWRFRVTFFFLFKLHSQCTHKNLVCFYKHHYSNCVLGILYNTLHKLSLRKFIKCLLRLTTLLQVQEKYFSIEIR